MFLEIVVFENIICLFYFLFSLGVVVFYFLRIRAWDWFYRYFIFVFFKYEFGVYIMLCFLWRLERWIRDLMD